ncbi:hypothetical protein Gorai_012716, partial [Gossypium raimondii]|nr:hypothetical protein [Gossypium raimondii]
ILPDLDLAPLLDKASLCSLVKKLIITLH